MECRFKSGGIRIKPIPLGGLRCSSLVVLSFLQFFFFNRVLPPCKFLGSPLAIRRNLKLLTLMSTVVAKLSAEEVRQEIKAIQNAGKRIRKSRKSALDFLVRHGFLTKTGKFTKRYGG